METIEDVLKHFYSGAIGGGQVTLSDFLNELSILRKKGAYVDRLLDTAIMSDDSWDKILSEMMEEFLPEN